MRARLSRFWEWFIGLEYRSIRWQLVVTLLGFAIVLGLGIALQQLFRVLGVPASPVTQADTSSLQAATAIVIGFLSGIVTAGFALYLRSRSLYRRKVEHEARRHDPALFRRLESDALDTFDQDDRRLHA